MKETIYFAIIGPMKTKTLKMDLILIGIFLLAGLVMAVVLLNKGSGQIVNVSVDGKLVATYSLSENGTYTIEGVDGTNTLVISDGYALVTEASCPDKLCVKMGKINKVGQSVVCLPNKVVVSIESSNEDDTQVDVISR